MGRTIRALRLAGLPVHHRGTESTENSNRMSWLFTPVTFFLLCALCVSVVNPW